MSATSELVRPGLVLPRWGTRRRTADEWVERGGDKKLLKPGDDGWPTLGHQPAIVSRRLGFEPMPHQGHIFDVAFELDPEQPDDLWYTESNIWLMRQCAKTTTMFIVGVHRLTMMPRRMGGRQRVAFTMQDRQETRKKLEIDFIPQLVEASDSFRRITNPKGRPGRSTMEWKSSLNNGSEHLLFGQGNYFLIDTPSKKAGHGGTIDVKMADEVRFGVDDRIEASAGPSQITRRSRQLWVGSTAGDEESWYMWPKVLAGRRRVERGDLETRVCSFEWAIPEDADLHDPDVWYEHHPAAGHTIAVDDILDELRKAEDSPDESKIDTFRNEYANQWVRTPLLGGQEIPWVIPEPIWTADDRQVSASSRMLAPLTLGWAVDDTSGHAAISIAGRNADGKVQHEVLDARPGTWWLERRFKDLVEDHSPVAIGYMAGHAPTAALAPAVARSAGDVPLTKISGTNAASACESFVTSFMEGRAVHVGQMWLTNALAGARKLTRGKSWVWDYQSAQTDSTPLVASTCAGWALDTHVPEPDDAPQELVGSLMA